MNNQEELNKLVGVHLGKAGDGTAVKPYITPDAVDKSLLVAIPRYLNRTSYDLKEDKLPFVGIDAWNAYEFSTLTSNGFPISGWLKFTYHANSPNIVESKSVKLYLNSYNMARLIKDENSLWLIEDTIAQDLRQAVGAEVMVNIGVGDIDTVRPIAGDFTSLESYCDVSKINFDQFNESADILKKIATPIQRFRWRSHSLRSNCRVTNQPDWGDVYVHIKGAYTVTPESLLQYIVSMRKENHFHEEIAECIYKRLWDMLQPDELMVGCLYTRRGGIDINPIRVSKSILYSFTPITDSYNFCTKTARQ